LTVVITVLVLGLLINFHEWGHFLVARRAGIICEEFSVGFGPRLLSWQGKNQTVYSLRAIPFGGYVRMASETPTSPPGEASGGETPEDEEAYRGHRFTDKPVSTRMWVTSAGSLANFVLAILLFALVYGVVGLPTATTTIDKVSPGYPAQQAGLRAGDRIVQVGERDIDDWMEFVQLVQRNPEQTLDITVVRAGRRTLPVTPTRKEDAPSTGVVGVTPRTTTYRTGLFVALAQGVLWTGRVIAYFVGAIVSLFTGAGAGIQFTGIVGIGAELGQASQVGPASLMFLVAALSANLGMVNLLPIPALDGGRLMFLTVEAIRGRPVDPDKESFIHFIGFALLILLAIFITYRDIVRLTG